MASVRGTSSMTMRGIVPPGAGAALVSATLEVAAPASATTAACAFVSAAATTAGAFVSAAATGGCAFVSAGFAAASATGALVAGAAASAAAVCGVPASLEEATLVAVLWGSLAGGLFWAWAATLEATNPTIVRMHSFSFIYLNFF